MEPDVSKRLPPGFLVSTCFLCQFIVNTDLICSQVQTHSSLHSSLLTVIPGVAVETWHQIVHLKL